VESDRASTAVLGTSFNIFSRGSRYEVVCLTGKVAVYTPGNKSEVLLDPNQKAILDDSGKLNTDSDIEAKQSISWTDNEFFFTSVPLPLVFDEIKRQYGINIIYNNIGDNLTYTGNFSRKQDIDTILDLVCKPFGIKFEMSRELTYLLSKDEYYR
jgi:ferric-dicitrate binding protein FerR (iron transport regulator)